MVFESLESAKKRGANIIAEIVGYHNVAEADDMYKPN
jgi:3-oxoacyl-(acyl-carrier-protein) synthase